MLGPCCLAILRRHTASSTAMAPPPAVQTVRLVELLDEARDRCLATIKERRGEDIQQEELEHSAAAMGYGAVKYADLRNNRTTNYR